MKLVARMKLVVANLKLYESLERNFLALGRVSSAAFNVWAEKEQVQSLVKVAELSEEILSGVGMLGMSIGGQRVWESALPW